MKLKTYRETFGLTPEAKDNLLAPFRTVEMKKRAELELAELQSIVCEREQKVNQLCTSYPIDFEDVRDALDEAELAERAVGQMTQIIADLFPEDK